jgi:hypothetical protein
MKDGDEKEYVIMGTMLTARIFISYTTYKIVFTYIYI